MYSAHTGIYSNMAIIMKLNGFRIVTPIRVAREVLEQSPHSIIVGEGAQRFAISRGFSVGQLKPAPCSKVCRATRVYRVAHENQTFAMSQKVSYVLSNGVATHVQYGWIFSSDFVANFLGLLSLK